MSTPTLTVPEAADRLKKSPDEVRRLLRTGELRGFKRPGSRSHWRTRQVSA